MAQKGQWRRYSTRISGAQMGAAAISVYICKHCGTWHERPPSNRKPPDRCMNALCTWPLGEFDFFASVTEAKRWAALKLQERAGVITELERQVRFPLLTIEERTGKPVEFAVYVCDFRYRVVETRQQVIEDAKPPDKMDSGAQLKLRVMEKSGRTVSIV
jgi:hypothetical protein